MRPPALDDIMISYLDTRAEAAEGQSRAEPNRGRPARSRPHGIVQKDPMSSLRLAPVGLEPLVVQLDRDAGAVLRGLPDVWNTF